MSDALRLLGGGMAAAFIERRRQQREELERRERERRESLSLYTNRPPISQADLIAGRGRWRPLGPTPQEAADLARRAEEERIGLVIAPEVEL